MKRLVVISNHTSERLNYVLTFLTSIWDVEILLNAKNIKEDDFVINYGASISSACNVVIPDEKLLFETNIEIVDFEVGDWKGLKTLFHSNSKSEMPFDLFSAIFYLLSRYEEYLPHTKDEHHRYLLKNSILYKEDIYDLPIVDLWVKNFYDTYLKDKGVVYKVCFNILPTFDIDIAYSFKGKGVVRSFGAVGKSLLTLNTKQLKKRFQTNILNHQDPYDTFNFIKKSLKNQSAIYFFQVGRFGKFDKNLSIKTSLMKNLIRSLANNQIGLHPSYQSNVDVQVLKTEKHDLEKVLNKPVVQSRQHYLKLQFPVTYQNLINIGVTDDYSLGYAEKIAFRAGTSYCFNWFNLAQNEITKLRVHPISLMDVSLKNYMNLQPEEAVVRVKKIKEIIKNVKGTFIPLWHNNSVSFMEDWNYWEAVYVECLKY